MRVLTVPDVHRNTYVIACCRRCLLLNGTVLCSVLSTHFCQCFDPILMYSIHVRPYVAMRLRRPTGALEIDTPDRLDM